MLQELLLEVRELKIAQVRVYTGRLVRMECSLHLPRCLVTYEPYIRRLDLLKRFLDWLESLREDVNPVNHLKFSQEHVFRAFFDVGQEWEPVQARDRLYKLLGQASQMDLSLR